MGPAADLDAPLELGDLPTRGLREVLTSWSAGGRVTDPEQLLAALAATGTSQVDVERAWQLRDVRCRAARVLWSLLLPELLSLPDQAQTWVNALPAVSTTSTVISPRPSAPINWGRTVRLNLGWPPPRGVATAQFATRVRNRVADDVMVSILRWSADRLLAMQQDAARMLPEVVGQAAPQMEALAEIRAIIGSGTDAAPSVWQLAALQAAGDPWNRLAEVVGHLLELEDDPFDFALQVIWPDESLRGRLFHLAIYGQLLVVLRELGYAIEARVPLSGSAASPNHVAVSWRGDDVELWFEGTGAWKHYGFNNLYKLAAAGVPRRAALSPDCLAVRVRDSTVVGVLALECKDSASTTYVARNGYLQALAYGTEFAVGLRAPTLSFALGPSTVVQFASDTDVFDAHSGLNLRVGVGSAKDIEDMVDRLLA